MCYKVYHSTVPLLVVLSLFSFPVSGGSWSSGSVISVPDLVEGEIIVPPPPSMAPPPPPGTFIPPPPDFIDGLKSPVQPMMEEDFSSLKPPTMAPPKPPSICSSGSASSLPISTPPSDIPEPPKFAPPQLPSEKQHKSSKTPPPKPTRLSSIPNMDSPPQTPAPPPPVQTPTRSTFNPQNTAKLYNIPKPSVLGGIEDHPTKPKHMLVLEDSGSGRSTPVLIEVGNTPKVATPSKPVSKDVQELKENLNIVRHSPPPMPEPDKDNSPPLEKDKSLQTVHQTSPQLQKPNSTVVNSESSKDRVEGSTSQSGKYSPILDRKLRNLKSSETSTAREAHVASPFALLMAAKERDKHRSSHVSSLENNIRKSEQSSAVFHPSDSSPNSFIVTPRSGLSSSLSSQNTAQEDLKLASKQTIPEKSSADTTAESLSPTHLVAQKQTEQSPPKPQSTKHEDDKEELIVPLLPPPPEFDDLDETVGLPPSIPPPAPAAKMKPTPNAIPDPAPLPKPKPPEAPKLPPPDTKVKPKPQVQAKPKAAPPQLPSTLSPSQATLMGILQRKMLEMDQKMGPVKMTESPSDDWGTPLSDENNKVPVVPRVTPQSKNGPAVNKAATLDMRELEGKMAKKKQEMSSAKFPIR